MYAANLETFIAVADAGSFTKAAEKLYISSTAVIKQINTLEGYLDVSLFERLHRGLLLTEAGKVYYRDAKYMIQYAKEARERARNAMKAKGNVLRVGVSPITPPHIVEEFWCKMQEEASDIRLRFVPFENTKENAREILAHLGENIDIVCGIFDNVFLEKCWRDCGFRSVAGGFRDSAHHLYSSCNGFRWGGCGGIFHSGDCCF